MSKTKSYFAFHKSVFTFNYYDRNGCDVSDYINEITEAQFKVYKKKIMDVLKFLNQKMIVENTLKI